MPDGSSSRLLTTSGMSSKDVYATDGRYGYVVFKFDGLFWGDTAFFPGSEPADFLLVSWVDLLPYAPRHTHGCGHGTRYSQHDEPNQLSGVPRCLASTSLHPDAQLLTPPRSWLS